MARKKANDQIATTTEVAAPAPVAPPTAPTKRTRKKPTANAANTAVAPATTPVAEATAAATQAAPAATPKAPAKPKVPGVAPGAKTRYFFAAKIIKKHGHAAGVTDAMVAELDEAYGKPNTIESEIALRNCWHAIRSWNE